MNTGQVSPAGAVDFLEANGYPVKESTLAEWRSTGRNELPYIKCGRLVRYRVADLEAFLQAKGVKPAPVLASGERRILKRPEVERITSLSRSEIYRRMAAGSFPASVSLGGRAVGWFSDAIEAWLAGLNVKGGVQ